MKKYLFIPLLLVLLIMVTTQCTETKKEEQNPFFTEWNTPFGIPPFESIKPEHYIPAMEKGMEEQNKEIEAIVNNPEEPTWDNTLKALDYSGELLRKVLKVYYNQISANTNDELQKVQTEMSPKLSAHFDEISLNPKLFERIKYVYENQDKYKLTDEEKYLLENHYKELVRNGANLSPEDKEKLKEINQKLSKLEVKFNQNLLAETNKYKIVIDDEKDLEGLPQSVIDAGAAEAKAAGLDGKWVYTVQRPSMYPFLTYSKNRELRKKLYNYYTTRANHDDEHDNKAIVAEIVALRADKAKLLGYKNHASLVLEPRMAKTPERAYELLYKIWDAALPVAKKEAGMMQDMIDKEGGNFKLQSWDWWYYAEKIRKAKYNLDEGEVRPYFELSNVRDGVFWNAQQLFGITFTRLNNVPLPHPDAEAYEVKEADGSHLGILFLDFFPRESKRGGAWCDSYKDHRVINGKEEMPIVTIVTNFTKPAGDTPSLLSMDEVETLFHEFGHGLDGLFNKASYNTTYIAWDFVELPSQIDEHWATQPEVLNHYAKHYKTGEVIPEELVKKMDAASKFNQGFANVEYLAASMLDLKYHTLEAPVHIDDINKFEKDYLNSIGLIPEIEPRYRTTYFAHIIGGYDAGYYSYIWAAVLDNDAFEAFKENGIFDKATAESYRKNILEKNGIEDPMKMYIDFRGREPEIEPLLRNRGLLN
ncbi:MAG: M3 family metallopeptidase [Chlorobi bacterium]|nr:M3 family metallopeptidase [Chlorobiota bacterium]